jgi:hypothetical protein
VILTDTGPLVALVNRNDPNHMACLEATKTLPAAPLQTTWPCFTEAMYLVFRAGGYHAQEALWQLRSAGRLVLLEPEAHVSPVPAGRVFPIQFAGLSLPVLQQCKSPQRGLTADSFWPDRLLHDSAAQS